MNNIIELDNSYYIEILNRNNEIPVNTVDICHLSLIKVLKSKNIVLRIDFDKFNIRDYKRILKNLLRVKNVAKNINKEFGITEKEKKNNCICNQF